MKRLFVLRHAKSSWDNPDLADYDRPLNQRGMASAPLMGRLMAARKYFPDFILSSPAKRARETARLVKDAAGFPQKIKFDDRVYEASPQKLAKVLSELDDDLNSAMIVGHNPGMEGLIRFLTGEQKAMSTASLAIIDLKIKTWAEIATRTGRLVDVIRPKDVDTTLQ